MSLRTSTKLKSFFDFKDEEVVPDVFDIPALSFDHFHDDFYELSEVEAMPSFSGDEVYFDAKEKNTKKKEKLPTNEGTLEQLFFPSAAVVLESAKEKVRSNTKSSKESKDLSLTENGRRRKPSTKSEGVSKQSRSSPSLAAMGLASSNYGNARKSSKTDKDLANDTWNLVVAGLSSSSEHGRRTKSSKTNVGMPDLCLSSSSDHGGRRKATKGSKDLIKKLGFVDLGQSSSLEQKTRRKSATANRDFVKNGSSAPRLAGMSLSSSSEHGKGRKSSKASKGLADNTWSLADMSLFSSSEHRSKFPSKCLDKLGRRSSSGLSSSSEHRNKLSSKGLDKLDRRSSSGLSSSSEHRRKVSSKGLDKLDRSSLLGLSSSSEHRKRRKSPKARKGIQKSTSSPTLARISLLSPPEDRKRRTRKSLTKVIDECFKVIDE
jgi:hypothetical protein